MIDSKEIERLLADAGELRAFRARKYVKEKRISINSIEENVNSMGMNIKNAVNHMEEAKKSNESSSGYTNVITLSLIVSFVAGILCTIIYLILNR